VHPVPGHGERRGARGHQEGSVRQGVHLLRARAEWCGRRGILPGCVRQQQRFLRAQKLQPDRVRHRKHRFRI
ncbi:MAG: hypothetical protein AVDCRST_MAG89-2203, partial [uncultured Gemmatimonadetes bacterium]